jgi:hypothetical protein
MVVQVVQSVSHTSVIVLPPLDAPRDVLRVFNVIFEVLTEVLLRAKSPKV